MVIVPFQDDGVFILARAAARRHSRTSSTLKGAIGDNLHSRHFTHVRLTLVYALADPHQPDTTSGLATALVTHHRTRFFWRDGRRANLTDR